MNKKNGFTIIEIIVCIVILGIIGVIAYEKFNSAMNRATINPTIKTKRVVLFNINKNNDTIRIKDIMYSGYNDHITLYTIDNREIIWKGSYEILKDSEIER